MNVRPKRLPRLHCALQGLLPLLPEETRPPPPPEPPAAPDPGWSSWRGRLLLVVIGAMPIVGSLVLGAYLWSSWSAQIWSIGLTLAIGKAMIGYGVFFLTRGWLLFVLPLGVAFGLRLVLPRAWPFMVVGLALVFSIEVAQWVPLLQGEDPDWGWIAAFGLPWAMTGMFLAEAARRRR